MKFHIIKLNDNVDNIAKEIKLHFLNKCNYIIIQNDKYLKNNEEDIRHFYELLNTKIGIIKKPSVLAKGKNEINKAAIMYL